MGPSPRGRGHRIAVLLVPQVAGAIPARAGAPHAAAGTGRPSGGHPRAGGGTIGSSSSHSRASGPSPRGRGHPWCCRSPRRCGGAIPARAGAPTGARPPGGSPRGHPRAGGGTMPRRGGRISAPGPSPRGRGHPDRRGQVDRAEGAIPARAGAPAIRIRALPQIRGHPRAGGGTRSSDNTEQDVGGPSPRGRGHRGPLARLLHRQRAIPARAGAPSVPISRR